LEAKEVRNRRFAPTGKTIYKKGRHRKLSTSREGHEGRRRKNDLQSLEGSTAACAIRCQAKRDKEAYQEYLRMQENRDTVSSGIVTLWKGVQDLEKTSLSSFGEIRTDWGARRVVRATRNRDRVRRIRTRGQRSIKNRACMLKGATEEKNQKKQGMRIKALQIEKKDTAWGILVQRDERYKVGKS